MEKILFEYKNSPSKDHLIAMINAYTENSGEKLFIDQGPTGLGKTHSIIEMLAQTLREERIPENKRIVVVCPLKRHLYEIKKGIEQRVPGLAEGTVAVIESREEAFAGLDEKRCPLLNGADRRYGELAAEFGKTRHDFLANVEILRSAGNLDDTKFREYVQSEAVRTRKSCFLMCPKYIHKARSSSKDIDACRSCYARFPGNAALRVGSPARIILLTYDRLNFGLSAFIESGKTSGRDEPVGLRLLSCWSDVALAGIDAPDPDNRIIGLGDCAYIFEEAHQGFGRIQSNQLSNRKTVPAIQAIEELARPPVPAYKAISLLGYDSAFSEDNRKWLFTLAARHNQTAENLYVTPGVTPFKRNNESGYKTVAGMLILPRGEPEVLNRLRFSTTPIYGALFSGRTLWIECKTNPSKDNELERFEVWSNVSSENGSVSFFNFVRFAFSALSRDCARCYVAIERAAGTLSDERAKPAPEDFLRYLTPAADNRLSALGDFIRNRAYSLNERKANREPFFMIEPDPLERLYEMGLELFEIVCHSPGRLEVNYTYCANSPEKMLENLLSSNARVYYSSASAPVRSVFGVDLPWAISRAGSASRALLPRSIDKCKFEAQLRQKAGVPGVDAKVLPEIVWGSDAVTLPEDIRIEFQKKHQKKPDVEKNHQEYNREISAVLKTFIESLLTSVNRDEPVPRVGIVFFNAREDVREARRILEAALGSSLYVQEVFASWFREPEAADDISEGEENSRKQFETRLSEMLKNPLNPGSPSVFLLLTTYNSMSTGANITITLDGEIAPGAAFWRYVSKGQLRVFPDGRLSCDISDIVLAERPTNVINEDNYLYKSFQILAKGEPLLLSRNLRVSEAPDQMLNTIRGAIYQTAHFNAAVFEAVMQAVGRMDRTLNSAAHPRVFLAEGFAGLLAGTPKEVIGETVLTPAMNAVMRAADVRRDANRQGKTFLLSISSLNGLSASEAFSMWATLFRDTAGADKYRQNWGKVREFLRTHQVIDSKNFPLLDSEACGLPLKFGETGSLTLEDCYIKVSEMFLEEQINEQTGLSKLTLCYRSTGEELQVFPAMTWNAETRTMTYTWQRQKSRSGRELWLVKPELMRDVVLPAEAECDFRNKISKSCEVMPPEAVTEALYERADLFIEALDLAVDVKSWSESTLESALANRTLDDLVEKARNKLAAMRTDAAGGWAPERFVYAFTTWPVQWRELLPKRAILFPSEDDWDVAFLCTADFANVRSFLTSLKRLKENAKAKENTEEVQNVQ